MNWFQRLMGHQPNLDSDQSAIARPSQPSAHETTPYILLVGIDELGSPSLIRHLLKDGYCVRSLVADLTDARRILGNIANQIDLVEIRSDHANRLDSDIVEDVCEDVCAAIVFANDRINADQLTQWIQAIAHPLHNASHTSHNHKKIIIDFSNSHLNLQDIWDAVDDVVMGGVSQSTIHPHNSVAEFTGQVSTENSGGFASIRTRNFSPPLDLTPYQSIELRVKGDGNRYKFLVRDQSQWDGIAYSYSFDTEANQWMTVRIPFTDMIPTFRAKTQPQAGTLDLKQVQAFQLMLSKFEYDGALNPRFETGLFQLQIASIQAYSHETTPQLVILISQSDIDSNAIKNTAKSSGVAYTIIQHGQVTTGDTEHSICLQAAGNPAEPVDPQNLAKLCASALETPRACNVVFVVGQAVHETSLHDPEALFEDAAKRASSQSQG
ncbi:MAG: CIA30 family protein [Elainellaceae cyanobacterium]